MRRVEGKRCLARSLAVEWAYGTDCRAEEGNEYYHRAVRGNRTTPAIAGFRAGPEPGRVREETAHGGNPCRQAPRNGRAAKAARRLPGPLEPPNPDPGRISRGAPGDVGNLPP